ncbi:MAG: sulfide/dihydroorotate dehydrogenase-like FAD/NAD-binding protein [Bacilli bacterium]|nr:sulfide/dihydroorotate dehydrogenase-like FAD/NAD-binding protein [Bacilli bacterium]
MTKIIRKEALNDSIIRITISDQDIACHAKPGQFAILRVNSNGERIPLTIHNVNGNDVSFIYQIVGRSTYELSKLEVGDDIEDVCGPLGKPTEIDGVKKAIVIGGGAGSAIAYPIAKALKDKGADVTSILGFRNKDLIILEKEFSDVSKLYITTDDGSYGVHGLVTNVLKDLIEKDDYDSVYAIGPLIMMKYVALTTKDKNVKTIVSMNPIMVDGTGMCGGCRVSVDGKIRFACVDGPDFDGHKVDFDETIKRNNFYKAFEREDYDNVKHNCNLFKEVK